MNVFAPINSLGYGIMANNFIKALVELQQTPYLSTIGEIQNDPFFESYWKPCTDFKRYDCNKDSLFLFHDNDSHKVSGKTIYTLSMFETTKLKESSRYMLENGPTDIILTPTKEHKEILLANNISKPIQILHCGIDDSIFNTIPVEKFIDTKKFTIITTGKREKRKNTDLILKTLIEQCKEKEIAIISHTFNPFLNKTNEHPFKNLSCWSGMNPVQRGFEYKGFDNKCHKFSYKKCDIYFTVPGIETIKMPSLYHSANVGIQMSSAEGWDLPCILPGTQIITNNGIKNIENVEKHDKLLTHEGRFQPINKIMIHPNTKKTFEIKTWTNNELLQITEEHPIYAISKTKIQKYEKIFDIEPEWIKAKDIKKGDIVIRSTITETLYPDDWIFDLLTLDSTLEFNDTEVWYKMGFSGNKENSYTTLAKDFSTSKYILESAFNNLKANKRARKKSKQYIIEEKLIENNLIKKPNIKYKRFINIDNLARTIGLYIAEGSLNQDKGIIISIHKKEIDTCVKLLTEDLSVITNFFHLSIKHEKQGYNGAHITIGSKLLSKLFKYLCNSGAKNKKIPNRLLYSKLDTLEKIIKWYHFGDGSILNNRYYSISTISKELCEQVFVAVQRLGFLPNKHISIRSQPKNNNTTYIVSWLVVEKERKIGSGNRSWKHKYGLGILVKNIKEINYTENVYNFEVAVDNSYTLNVCTVHNCSEMFACGLYCATTNCLGHNEFLPTTFELQNTLTTIVKEEEVALDNVWFHGDVGTWSAVSKSNIVEKIEFILENTTQFENKSDELADYMSDNFTWKKTTSDLLKTLS